MDEKGYCKTKQYARLRKRDELTRIRENEMKEMERLIIKEMKRLMIKEMKRTKEKTYGKG